MKKKSKLEKVIKETFELDEQGDPKFKDEFDSFSILITRNGTKLERTRRKNETKRKKD